MESVTDRILLLIEQNNTNAKSILEKLELSNSAITDWKKGKAKPSASAIIKLADYFGVTTDYLLLGIPTPPEPAASLSVPNSLTPDALELLSTYNSLDRRGQHRVHTVIYEEIDRMGNAKKEPAI